MEQMSMTLTSKIKVRTIQMCFSLSTHISWTHWWILNSIFNLKVKTQKSTEADAQHTLWSPKWGKSGATLPTQKWVVLKCIRMNHLYQETKENKILEGQKHKETNTRSPTYPLKSNMSGVGIYVLTRKWVVLNCIRMYHFYLETKENNILEGENTKETRSCCK